MLNKLVIINSDLYNKAEINLGTHKSIQIVGPNNIGKSSLINALNFLYIIDTNLMRFEGKRTLQKSLKHYFPSIKTSYIIFEIKSAITYCILAKRNEENTIEYHYIAHAYDERHFLKPTEERLSVRPFDELLNYFLDKKIRCDKYKSHRALTSKVYNIKGSKEGKDPIILLSGEKTGSNAKSPHKIFKKIYGHLIGSRALTTERLQEIVIDTYFAGYKQELTVFRDRTDNALERFDKIFEKRKRLQEAEPLFKAFKKVHNAAHEEEQTLGKAYYSFCLRYKESLQKLNTAIAETKQSINALDSELTDIHRREATINRSKGACDSNIRHHEQALQETNSQLKHIADYDNNIALSTLERAVKELEREKQRLEEALLDKNDSRKSTQTLQREMEAIQRKIQHLTATINDFDNILIHHISPKLEVRKRLNHLLSQELLHLPKKAIKKPVTHIAEPFTLCDGAIDTTDITSEKPFSSLEKLKEERGELKTKAQSLQTILNDSEALEKAERAWDKKFELLRKVKAKPEVLSKQQQIEVTLKKEREKSQAYAKELAGYERKKKTISHHLEEERKEQQKRSSQKSNYTSWKQELQRLEIPPIEQSLEEQAIEKLYQLVIDTSKTANTKAVETKKKLINLLQKLDMQHINTDDRVAAITEIQEEYNSMENLNEEIEYIHKILISELIVPTHTFFRNYKALKERIEGFSQKLARSHISGIEKIELLVTENQKLLSDLQAISALPTDAPLFAAADHKEQTNLLRDYIEKKKTIPIEELFSLEMQITDKESRKRQLNINEQMESRGTDKVIRIFISLMLLKQLFVIKPDNRIAIYIDEVGTIDKENVQRILDLCTTYHALPIFASTETREGFHAHYLVSMDGNKRVVSEHSKLEKPNK